jgi:hypothetical protein
LFCNKIRYLNARWQTLAAQPDGSVAIIQVGYSPNQARSLERTADTVSPMAGP